MKVIYSGYYGGLNSGDDAFCEVAAWGAAKYWGATDHLFFTRSLPAISTAANYYSPHAGYFSFTRGVFDVLKSDIFVSAGGSTFHSRIAPNDLRFYAKLKKAGRLSGKVGAIGISLGPYADSQSENDIRAYLERLDFLALRDQKSLEIAESYNLPYRPVRAFDLAALLPSIFPAISENGKQAHLEGKKIVGVAACNYERYIGGSLEKEKMRNDFVFEVLDFLRSSENIHFRFFVFNGSESMGDRQLTDELIRGLSDGGAFSYEIVPYLGDVRSTFMKVSECDLIFSTRLHASVFACYGGVPFFLMEYHRKCSDFLDDVGHGIEFRVGDGEVSAISAGEAMLKVLFDGAYRTPKFLADTVARALLNFTETV